MIRFHLTIKIFNDFFQWKLDSRWKINSVWFDDYDLFMEKVLHDMDLKDINKFKLNLFNRYRENLSYCYVTRFINDWIEDWYMIPTCTFNVSSNVIALCVPNRRVRDKYFEYDILRERYYVKSDFIFYLKS